MEKPKDPGGAPSGSLAQQAKDAEFLTREFDVPVNEASALVAREGVEPRELKQQITTSQGGPALPDPLAGVPVPTAPTGKFTNDADEHARKPVVHRRIDTRGAG